MITLYWNIPSKKNNKVWTGKYLISSKDYLDREKKTINYLKNIWFNEKYNKCFITYIFYYPDNRQRDLSNWIESINDMLVKYWTIPDDNWKIIIWFTAKTWWVDKENPRVEINIQEI